MEYALGEQKMESKEYSILSLNPCCNGICSRSGYTYVVKDLSSLS